MRIVEMG